MTWADNPNIKLDSSGGKRNHINAAFHNNNSYWQRPKLKLRSYKWLVNITLNDRPLKLSRSGKVITFLQLLFNQAGKSCCNTVKISRQYYTIYIGWVDNRFNVGTELARNGRITCPL